MTQTATEATTGPRQDHQRGSLLRLGWLTTALAVLHLVDHALRGERVHSHGLNPMWDHSGWPFQDEVTPYTFSLSGVLLILGLGLWGTYRGRLWAGYWVAAAVVLGAVVTVVHFLPTAQQESPAVIYRSWAGLSAMGVVAVGITFAIVLALVLMAVNAVRVGRSSRRWW